MVDRQSKRCASVLYDIIKDKHGVVTCLRLIIEIASEFFVIVGLH